MTLLNDISRVTLPLRIAPPLMIVIGFLGLTGYITPTPTLIMILVAMFIALAIAPAHQVKMLA